MVIDRIMSSEKKVDNKSLLTKTYFLQTTKLTSFFKLIDQNIGHNKKMKKKRKRGQFGNSNREAFHFKTNLRCGRS